MIIADENIDQAVIALMRDAGYEVISIRENHPGISDEEVVQIVQTEKGVLITEDKDFGELVFAHGIKEVAVIFIRFDNLQLADVENALKLVLEQHYPRSSNFFITISDKKIRLTKL